MAKSAAALVLLALALAASGAQAARLEAASTALHAATLRASIHDKLAEASSVDAAGIENCLNKCQLLFNATSYSLQQQGGGDTYEYRACSAGCQICEWQLNTNKKAKTCYTMCKDTDWLGGVPGENNVVAPVNKGIVEADKACMFGCVINTCQGVCSGGTLGMKKNKMWWPNGGCSIKTGEVRPGGFYSQNAAYTWWNTVGGQGGQDDCCSNAISLCDYSGDENSQNYYNVYRQAYNYCKSTAGLGKVSKQGANTVKICNLVTSGACGQEQIE